MQLECFDVVVVGAGFFGAVIAEQRYPIKTAADRAMLASYDAMTASHPNIVFGGRLGSYKYLDMHQAIGAALKTFEYEVEPFLAQGGMQPGDAAARRDALSALSA